MVKTAWLVYPGGRQGELGRLMQAISAQNRKADEVLGVYQSEAERLEAAHGAISFGKRVHCDAQWPIGKVLNEGIRATDAEVVVVASTSVVPLTRHFFSDVVRIFEQYPRVAAVRCLRVEDRPRLSRWMHADGAVDSLEDVERAVLAGPNVACFGIRRSAWAEAPFDECARLSVDKIWSYFAIRRGHWLWSSDAMFSETATAGLIESYRQRSRQSVEFHRATGEYVRHTRPSLASTTRGVILVGPRMGLRYAVGSVLTFAADMVSHMKVRGAQRKRVADATRDRAHV